jgi:hypothetical protein
MYDYSGGYQDPYTQNKALTSQMAPATGFPGGAPIKTSGAYQTAYTPPPPTRMAPVPGQPTTGPSYDGSGTGPRPGGTYAAPAPTGGAQSAQSYWNSLFPVGSQINQQQLLAQKDNLAAHGMTLMQNAEGTYGKVKLADGSIVDIGRNISGSGTGTSQWLTGGSGQASPGGLTTFKMPTPQVAPHQGMMNSLLTQLMGRAKQGTNVDTGAANFRQQSDAFAAAQERARRDSIANNAEAKSAQGLAGSGAERSEDRMINERAATARGGFEAQLVGSELMNRRQEIQSALSQMGGLLNDEQSRTLQRSLADIDAQLRMAGINSSERMANNSLGFNYTQLENQANQAALRMMMGGY